MAEVFNITHESGDDSDYTTIVESDGVVAFDNTNSGLAGTNFGLAATITSATSSAEGKKNFTTVTATTFVWRFYFDPNGITMDDGDTFIIQGINHANDNKLHHRVQLGKTDAEGLFLNAGVRNDSDSWTTGDNVFISDAPHLIELSAVKATGVSSNNSTLAFSIDGVLKYTVTGVDLYTDWGPVTVRNGAIGGMDSTTSGTIYIDEIKANNDGGAIGGIIAINTLNTTPFGFNVNAQAAAGTGVETLKTPPDSGQSHYIESVTFTGDAAATVTLGSGRTGVNVATEIVGPIEMTTVGRPYEIKFERPVKVDVDTAITLHRTGAVQVNVQGYTK
jgi:hypothetical protein